MLGFVLDAIFTLMALRAVWKLIQGVMHGMSGQASQQQRQSRPSGVPAQGVQMARDPVCGTYVVPDHAVAITSGRQHVYFCSTDCRDKYRAKTA
jgi:YHS domain-containing protein